jgi:hypothetical protein
LKEILVALREQRIRASRTARWRFLDRHKITRKKKSLHATEQEREDVARARRKWNREQGLLDSTKLVFIDETSVSTNMLRLTPPTFKLRAERFTGPRVPVLIKITDWNSGVRVKIVFRAWPRRPRLQYAATGPVMMTAPSGLRGLRPTFQGS